jgi:predicted N-acyltransferase
MAPFSPTPFYPFFCNKQDKTGVPGMLEKILHWAQIQNIPTVQSNFIQPKDGLPFLELGFTPWAHQEYLWQNPGYQDFDDYLGHLRKNRRRSIFKERRKLKDLGYRTEMVRGLDYPGWGKKMQRFYELTNAQFGPWAAKFLSKTFFDQLERTQNPDVYLCLGYAPQIEEPVAMSFFLVKKPWMSGRYWGSVDQQKFLHFEVCYYAPQEWAIQEGIRSFDPGMGSHHKAGRGFHSRLGWSLHKFQQPGLQDAFRNIALEWSSGAWREAKHLNERLPFRTAIDEDTKKDQS